MSTTQSRTPQRDNAGPPEYDTLSLAPPSINAQSPDARRTSSQAEDVDPSRSKKKSLKERWQDLKDEDERHKAARLQHVTSEEADRITGLDNHKEREARKSAEGKRGGKSLLGMLMLG